MKQWLWQVLSGLGLCLLLVLDRPEVGKGMDTHPCVAGWGRSVGTRGEAALASATAALAPAPESLTTGLVSLIERGVGPRGWIAEGHQAAQQGPGSRPQGYQPDR